MAYATRELYTAGSDITPPVRVYPKLVMPKTFAAVGAAPTYERLTPVAYNTSVDKWVRWTGLTDFESASIAVDATGGTFTITIEGQATAAIAFNATAAAVQAAVELLPGIGPGDLAVTGGPGVAGGGTPYVITWGGRYQGTDAPPVTTGAGSLTGGAGTAAVTTTAGVAKNGADIIRGFVWPDAVVIDASNDVLANVLLAGDVDYNDVVLFAGEVAASLKNALRVGLRERGITITGLDLVR